MCAAFSSAFGRREGGGGVRKHLYKERGAREVRTMQDERSLLEGMACWGCDVVSYGAMVPWWRGGVAAWWREFVLCC
jgi:hypothetical protein